MSVKFIENNSSVYSIVIPKKPSPAERYAAEELREFIQQSSGVCLDVVCGEANSPFVSIGNTFAFGDLEICLEEKALNYDGFIIKGIDGNVYVCGANDRGTVYGAYEFLERFFGIKFLAPGETLVPKHQNVVFEEPDITEKPVFRFRNFYDGGIFFSNQNPEYADVRYNVRRRMFSDYSALKPEWGYNEEWFKEIRTDHNIFSYVPKDKYQKAHPEFFTSYTSDETTFDDVCYLNGLNDDGSVDESKDVSVFKIALNSLKGFIKKNDTSRFFMVGINDANDYCRCSRCERAYQKYGERSGTMCLFVNALSREIETWKKEEGITRETNLVIFAYSWCYRAPVKKDENGNISIPQELKLRDNIYVRYCIFSGDNYNQAYSFVDKRQSRAAVENLRDWAAITNNIMIWDYCANYDAYYWYFPCLNYMAENIKYYHEINTKYLMSLSAYTVYREWSTLLRSYVASKLFWNYEQDVYALAYEFIDAYHGPFACYVRQFFDSFERYFAKLVARGDYFVAMNDWSGNMSAKDHDIDFLMENIRVLKKGLCAVKDSNLPDVEKELYRQRIQLALLIPQFMVLRNYDAYGLNEKELFFQEFVEYMRDCGLLTDAIKNEF
ncbi:MAG: DUF4838 domain-containing protein, partial [Clostridia bacterium]|nr:DUF4838 domain-containing protein [Clostridia bacterium]